MKKISIILMTIVIGALLIAGSAIAIPITGEIHFGGTFNPTGGTDLSNATGITIPFAFVSAATDSFASLAPFSPVTFKPLTFASTPVDSFWTAGLFTFDLETVGVDFQDAKHVALSGVGTLNGSGFDPTFGTWSFSGDSGGVIFSFSSNSVAGAPVPEPATSLLLGCGLVGIFFVSRRKRRA